MFVEVVCFFFLSLLGALLYYFFFPKYNRSFVFPCLCYCFALNLARLIFAFVFIFLRLLHRFGGCHLFILLQQRFIIFVEKRFKFHPSPYQLIISTSTTKLGWLSFYYPYSHVLILIDSPILKLGLLRFNWTDVRRKCI